MQRHDGLDPRGPEAHGLPAIVFEHDGVEAAWLGLNARQLDRDAVGGEAELLQEPNVSRPLVPGVAGVNREVWDPTRLLSTPSVAIAMGALDLVGRGGGAQRNGP
jgi:hypothetical protein